ncbi:helix-hairpin-helix domain-containing protein [Halomicrobium salinisoli]|uniref:helix-hairpin-helix domain-containing protein n=1 Tax=Halomicrobium salinisoli TaxID=2878391 RepID=UPI001CEFDB97|nr:helix-hairpin-helix domain-containing protein [Halomicrobium salinisoli]
MTPETLIGGFFGVVWVIVIVSSAIADRLPLETRVDLGLEDLDDPRTVEEIRLAYARGELTEDEMERRLEVAVDPRTKTIRAAVEPVSGIGPEIAINIAAEFESERDLQEASREDLEEVPQVGPKRAEAILERL